MRLEQLTYLDSVVRLGSFRKAADELGLSQPTLTQQIQRLESELGIRLLSRSRRGVQATDSCMAILPQARIALNACDAIRQEAGAFRGVRRGRLRIGSIYVANLRIIPRILAKFQSSFPAIELQITETGSLDIEEAVRQGVLDVGLVAREDSAKNSAGLEFEVLFLSRLVLCAPRNHPLLKKRSITFADVARQRLITLRKGYMLRRALEETGSELNIVSVSDSPQTVHNMVGAGLGVAIVSELTIADAAAHSDQVSYAPIDDPKAVHYIGMVRHAEVTPTSAASAFARLASAEARELQRRTDVSTRTPIGVRELGRY
jgi:LysR family hydrogen peroxide-inducible transcriptional activator